MSNSRGFGASQSVYRNFHESVPIGQNAFTVAVPRSFATERLQNGETRERKFRFTELYVTPGYFSQKALILGVDGDGTVEPNEEDLNLEFSLGYGCTNELFFEEDAREVVTERPFDQDKREMTLQDFVTEVNNHFQSLVPVGFTRSPVFLDWVDLSWYKSDGDEPDEPQQDTHTSADQTVPFPVDPESSVKALSQLYYEVDAEHVERYGNALPLSLRKMTGVNNYLLPTTLVSEDGEVEEEVLSNLRLRIHVAPNVTAAFSSEAQLEGLGFTAVQLGGRGKKKRYCFDNIGFGSDYLVFTAANEPSTSMPASTGKIYVSPTNTSFRFEQRRINFPAGSFSQNDLVLGIVRDAFARAQATSGTAFPQLRYEAAKSQFRFEFPANDRLSVKVECDDRLADRLGFGPVNRITRSVRSSAVRDGNSTADATELSKIIVMDAGKSIVTLNEGSSMDTYGVDDLAMTTLFPTSSGTLKMGGGFSRPTFLPFSGSGGPNPHLAEIAFKIWTLKANSERIPLSWPCTFTVEGTLEGIV